MLASPLDTRACKFTAAAASSSWRCSGGVDVAVEVATAALAAELATAAERQVQLAARRARFRGVLLAALDEDATDTVHLVLMQHPELVVPLRQHRTSGRAVDLALAAAT
jgi:hypothetical protein